MSIFWSTGQNTGRDAQIVATSTSRAARTIGVGPYHVGSNLQHLSQLTKHQASSSLQLGKRYAIVWPITCLKTAYVGEVVARVSTMDARRHMEKMLALRKVSFTDAMLDMVTN